jgi:hypothetical protein
VVADAHRLDNNHPFLFKTTDFGATWKSLTAKLPQDIYLHVVREDPQKQGLLYLGSERGISYSLDDGENWKELKMNLPTTAVHDLVVKNGDLVVGTMGRSIWIFDDLTPIREMTPQIAESSFHLFSPQPATRFRYSGDYYHAKGVGKNPPAGVIVNYFLKNKPKGEITLEILDSSGRLADKLSSKAETQEIKEDDPDAPDELPKKTRLTTVVGVNRVAWNLHYQGAEKIKHAKIDAGEPSVGPLALPGSYTLKLTVEGKTQSAPVTVEPDPRVHMSEQELKEGLDLALALRDQITRVTRLVHQIRSVRNQLATRDELLKENPKAEPLIKLGKELTTKLNALEEKIHNPKAEVAYDILAQKGGAKLYSKLGALYDFAQGSDGPPTQGDREVFAELTKELDEYQSEMHGLLSGDLAKINELARGMDVPNIIATTSSRAGK